MKSLADGLPPEIAEQVHPDWRKNETAYWAVRDQLLGEYQGQRIGFADGAVVAIGTRPVAVFQAAHLRRPAALGMVWGYGSAALHREPRWRDDEAAAHLRELQRLRALPDRAREVLGRRA